MRAMPAGVHDRRYRVVVADDAEPMRLLVRRLLERDGRFEIVGEAGDGADAIALVESQHPDALVIDLTMPKIDGMEAMPAIRQRSPDTKIVVLSARDPEPWAARAQAGGAHAYVEKGGTLDDLSKLLAGLCADDATP